MKCPKMAELQFEAPLASFENEEWSEFNEFKTSNIDSLLCKQKPEEKWRDDRDEGSNFDDLVSGSLEDLVNSFDERITKCFNNLEEQVEAFAPVQIRSQEEIMNDCQ